MKIIRDNVDGVIWFFIQTDTELLGPFGSDEEALNKLDELKSRGEYLDVYPTD